MNTSPAILEQLSACREACEWVRDNKHESLESAWLACERGDWLLWFAAKRWVDRKQLVLIACSCARLALPYEKSESVLKCIETAEAWTRGEATIEDVQRARCAAAYASDAYSAAYASAASAAAYASYASYAAAAAAAYASYASYAAAAAASYASYASYAASRNRVLKECADIVRKHLPSLP